MFPKSVLTWSVFWIKSPIMLTTDSFAQFTIGSHCLMLSQNHLIPLEDFQSGIILHIEVEDVNQNYQRLKEIGVEILHGPCETDWGTESLLVKGPAGLVLDFYRMK